MWVRTTSGKLVNIADAREIHLESSFEYTPKEAVKLIAVFPQQQFVQLAAVLGDEVPIVEANATILFQSLINNLRDDVNFFDIQTETAGMETH